MQRSLRLSMAALVGLFLTLGSPGGPWSAVPAHAASPGWQEVPRAGEFHLPAVTNPLTLVSNWFGPLFGGPEAQSDIKSLQEIVRIVRRRYPGRQLDARLNDARTVYELRWQTADNRILDIRVDARTGDILSVR